MTVALAKKPDYRVPEARFKLTEHVFNTYHVAVDAGVTVKQLLDPLAWTHVARRLRHFDELIVNPDDGSYRAHLQVRRVGNTHAHVVVLNVVEFGGEETVEADASGFEVRHMGAHNKHSVMRLRDKTVMQAGFATKEEAHAWLAGNIKSLAA